MFFKNISHKRNRQRFNIYDKWQSYWKDSELTDYWCYYGFTSWDWMACWQFYPVNSLRLSNYEYSCFLSWNSSHWIGQYLRLIGSRGLESIKVHQGFVGLQVVNHLGSYGFFKRILVRAEVLFLLYHSYRYNRVFWVIWTC